MKRWHLSILFILLGTSALHAEDKAREEANIILLKASDLETFKLNEAPKFHLEVHFSFVRPKDAEITGVYTREIDAPYLWHEELEFGLYKFHRVRIRKQIWTRSNSDFAPMPVQALWGGLFHTSFQLNETDVVKRVHDRKLNGIDVRCIEVETVRGQDKDEKQICVQKDNGYPVFWENTDMQVSYSDFSPIGPKVRPHRIAIDFEGMEKLVADVKYDEVEKFDPAGFEPIIGGEVADVCVTSTSPAEKYAPDPVTSLTLRHGTNKGKMITDVLVGPDGTVLNATVEMSLQDYLDATVLDGIKKWKFEPGTCNGKPVKSVTRITTTVR
jgi:TonB family protein